MAFADTLSRIRTERGMTQADLASRVFVTRQAISRWETGETMPGIDMMKLLAVTLGVPVTQLMDLPQQPVCQCCGTPFDVPDMPFGTNADGSENTDYCRWCYENGEFTSPGLDELIERNIPYLVAGSDMNAEEAMSFMGALLPTLKRWSGTAGKNVAGNVKRSKFYLCPTCGNLVWSMGAATVTCCNNVLQPLVPKKPAGPEDKHSATIEVIDGADVITMAHPMTKEHYISYIAAVGDDLVRVKRLYPESECLAIFPKQGFCTYYAYCNTHGFFKLN